jgi:hypothetical protein
MKNISEDTIFKNIYSNIYAINVGDFDDPYWISYDIGGEGCSDKLNPITSLYCHSKENGLGDFIPKNDNNIPDFVKRTLRNFPKLDEMIGALYIEQGDFISFFVYMNLYNEDINNDLYGDCFFVDFSPETGIHYTPGCYNSSMYVPIEDAIFESDLVVKIKSKKAFIDKCNKIGLPYIPKGLEKNLGFSLNNF